jgi:hypothetical protein
MKKIDWETYVKLFLGLFLIFPLECSFWSLEFGVVKGFIIATIIHLSLYTLGVFMMNYLESGDCFESIKKFKNK